MYGNPVSLIRVCSTATDLSAGFTMMRSASTDHDGEGSTLSVISFQVWPESALK